MIIRISFDLIFRLNRICLCFSLYFLNPLIILVVFHWLTLAGTQESAAGDSTPSTVSQVPNRGEQSLFLNVTRSSWYSPGCCCSASWSDQVSIHFVVYPSISLWRWTMDTDCLARIIHLIYSRKRAQPELPHSAECPSTPNMPAWFLAQWQELLLCFPEVVFESQLALLGPFALQKTLKKLKSYLLEPRFIILLLLSSFPRFLSSAMSLSLQRMQPWTFTSALICEQWVPLAD